MLSSKRIFVTLSSHLLSEIDQFTTLERKNRSEVVMEALEFYLGERRRALMVEQMKQGYAEMAEINLGIASESCHWEEEALIHCIARLMERT